VSDVSDKTLSEIEAWYDYYADVNHEVYENRIAQRRMEIVKGLLSPLLPVDRALDAGCALGTYSVWMVEQGVSEVVGVDISAGTLEMAQDDPRVTYVHSALEDFTDPIHYDLALCTETLEHLKDPQAVAKKLEGWADWVVASVPISEPEFNIGWDKQGHLHTFRMDTFAELFTEIDLLESDGIHGYAVAVGQ
jgi:2-polyprenyl-3-methyl-5-hydroxy-6-metoxy-1,4-benzoquinol methylase